MAMRREMPSGREEAIETLVDMDPQGNFFRAARVLEESVPQALFHRPNLVTKAALIDQAHALSNYEIDEHEKYDSLFGCSSIDNRIASNFNRQQLRTSLSEVKKNRVLRHHSKIMTVKKKIDSTKKIDAGGFAPSRQLVAALRRIYEKPGAVASEHKLPACFKSLLDSVSNHPLFSYRDGREVVNEGSSPPPIDTTVTKENPITGSTSAKESAYALESLIVYLCRESSSSDSSTFSTKLEHGMLITILSVLMEYETRDQATSKNQEASMERNSQDWEGQQHDATDDPTTAPPLQVGSIMSLLKTDEDYDQSNLGPFSVNIDLLSYFGEAAAVYEERIEIQKSRLLRRLSADKGSEEKKGDSYIEGKTAKDDASDLPTSLVTTPTSPASSQPVVDTPATPDVVATEPPYEEFEATADTLNDAVFEHIISAVAGEETSLNTGENKDNNDDEDDGSDDDDDDNDSVQEQLEIQQLMTGNIFRNEDGDKNNEDDDVVDEIHDNIDDNVSSCSSSSSSSSSGSDADPENEENNVGIDDGEENNVEALALGMGEAEPYSTRIDVSTNDDDARSISALSGSHLGHLTPVIKSPLSEDELENNPEAEESPLPTMPKPPRIHPQASMRSLNSDLNLSDHMQRDSMLFDPSSLNAFGSIPASNVLIHLLLYMNSALKRRKFGKSVERPISARKNNTDVNTTAGGIGSSLFAPKLRSFKSEALDVNYKTGTATSLQLLVSLFLLTTDIRNDAIDNLKRALVQEKKSTQDVNCDRSGEEGDDPAIALGLSYVDEEDSDSKESLEAKGMRRKAAAAAHDAAALSNARRKRTNEWKKRVNFFSECCFLSIESLRLFLQGITRDWLCEHQGMSTTDCHKLLPTSVISKLSIGLASLSSIGMINSFHTLFAGQDCVADDVESIFWHSKLYKSSIFLWGECVPIVYPSLSAQVEVLRSLLAECSRWKENSPHHRLLDCLTSMPISDSEPPIHRLQILSRRLRVSDLLDRYVSGPICCLAETEMGEKSIEFDEPNCARSVIVAIGSAFIASSGLKRDLQSLYLALCHRYHVRVLLWDGLGTCSESEVNESLNSLNTSPAEKLRVFISDSNKLQFDATKCSESISIISNSDNSGPPSTSSSINQRASKVWGTVLSSTAFSPKTGVYRWAIRLDKCERGHVFIGVATAQANMRTYVGGDKYGWGMIGTQALWHDRRKIRGDYGATFRTGSTIIVTLDTDAGTIAYSLLNDSASASSYSVDQVVQNISSPRRQGQGVSTIEDWGIAFEGLPLDSKLYPAVGLYQRDDKVTLMPVETAGNTRGRVGGAANLNEGLCYYPSLSCPLETDIRIIQKVRSFNEKVQVDGTRYVLNSFERIIRSVQEGSDDFLWKSLLPSLASAVCLFPRSIPFISKCFGLNLISKLSKVIGKLGESKMSGLLSQGLFHNGLQGGKWIIRATGSSGSNADAEEYVVDLSSFAENNSLIGFEGTGVGTIGKSKNGLVSIVGTVKGSSLHFVEEWTDASDEGFSSTNREDLSSSCVVNARLGLDGTKFEGTYHNIQFGTSGHIAGALCGDFSNKVSLFHSKDAPIVINKRGSEFSCGVLVGQSLLCLAYSHLASIIGEGQIDDNLQGTEHPISSNMSREEWEYHSIELKNCLGMKTFRKTSLASSEDDISEHVQDLRNYYFGSETSLGDELMVSFEPLMEELRISRADNFDNILTREEIAAKVERIDGDMCAKYCGMGSLSVLCPNEYRCARHLIIRAIVTHCRIATSKITECDYKKIWTWALKMMEDGVRHSVAKDSHVPVRNKATVCCSLFCSISEFVLGLDASFSSQECTDIDIVGADFSRFYMVISSKADLDFLKEEFHRSTKRALLRLIPIQQISNLVQSCESTNVVESLLVGIPRLLGRGSFDVKRPQSEHYGSSSHDELAGHYFSNVCGASGMRQCLDQSVHQLLNAICGLIEQGLERRKVDATSQSLISFDSMTLACIPCLTVALRVDDVKAFVLNSRLLKILPSILGIHRPSVTPPDMRVLVESEESSVIKLLHNSSHTEVSRAILRATVALTHVISYQAWNTSDADGPSECSMISGFLHILFNELENLIPLVFDSIEKSMLEIRKSQMKKQWEMFCEESSIGDAIGKRRAKTKVYQHRVGKYGTRFIQKYGMLTMTQPSSSSKTFGSRKSTPPQQVAEQYIKAQGMFSHHFVSHWIHILVAAVDNRVSRNAIAQVPSWIAILFRAVGIIVDARDGGEIFDSQPDDSFILLPARYRCRILRLLYPLLNTMPPSERIVRSLFHLAGSSCNTISVSFDEDEGMVSRETVSLLRRLHCPSQASWRACINNSLQIILLGTEYDLENHIRIGALCFFNGSIDSIKKGSRVLLKPAAAVPLSADRQAVSSSKSQSSAPSLVNSSPHHLVGNGTEGIVAGLCRNESSAGVVSSIDVKNGVCEIILLNRNIAKLENLELCTEQKLISSRHTLTVRALRSPMTDVVQAQEVSIFIDESIPVAKLAQRLIGDSLTILQMERYSEEATDSGQIYDLRSKMTGVTIALMALRSSITILSDDNIVVTLLKSGKFREVISKALHFALSDNKFFEGKEDLMNGAKDTFLSSLPTHEVRLLHVVSLFRSLSFEDRILGETPKNIWNERLQDIKGITEIEASGSIGNNNDEDYAPTQIEADRISDSPHAGSATTRSAGNISRAESTENRATSQSTTASDNSEDEEENEAAATAAAHLREAAIAQMAELGLPRSWSELALRRTGGINIEAAVHFCLERGGEMERLLAEERERQSSGVGSSRRRASRAEASSHLLRQLTEMGFPSRWCAEALNATGNNVDEALTWILTNSERLSAEDEGMEDIDDEDDDEDFDEEDEDSQETNDHQSSTNLDEELETEINDTINKNESDRIENGGWTGSVIPLRFISGRSIIDQKTLTISGLPSGGFSSVGSKGVMLTEGKWYYEAILETAGCLQIGWADGSFAGHCHSDRGDGCGDGPSSWAYDGWRRYRWHSMATEWGCRWAEGDVVGCLVDMDKGIISFTLNGRGEEIGMGVAFSGDGFRPCGGVYACVSFNRREKLRLVFGGPGSAAFKHPPPLGYRGVGEAVLECVKERDALLSKESLLGNGPEEFSKKRFLCDFSDGEHGHELMAWAHRYYGSDASVHLGSGRSKQSISNSKNSSSLKSTENVVDYCLAKRIKTEWSTFGSASLLSKNNDEEASKDIEILKAMKDGLRSAGLKMSKQALTEAMILSSLIIRKLLLHVVITTGESLDPEVFFASDSSRQESALHFWSMIEATASLRSAGWVGEAGAMAIAAEALGLGISSTESLNSRLSTLERAGFVSITDLDEGVLLPAGSITQLLNAVVDWDVDGNTVASTGNTFAASAEAAISGDGGGGVLSFLLKGLQAAAMRSEEFRRVIIASIRRSVRQLAVVEYENDDSTPPENDKDDEESTRSSTLKEKKPKTETDVGPYPDARLVSFLTGLLLSEPVAKSVENFEEYQIELFEAWSVGLLSASLPWRMICALTTAGILNQCSSALSETVKSFPTLSRYYSRLRSTVSRRIWAERAASPVCSRYCQAMVELLCSVTRAVNDEKVILPLSFMTTWKSIAVDAAMPLPMPETNNACHWEVEDGWVSSDRGWELWTGTMERFAVEWKSPSQSAVRTLMEGGDGPPMLREGCNVIRGVDWDDAKFGNDDGKDKYENEKEKRDEEKKSERKLPKTSDNEGPGNTKEFSDPIEDTTAEAKTASAHNLGEETANETKKKKKKPPSLKLPIGTVLSIEPWKGIPGMARRVRWHLTGHESVYRYGGDGGCYDVSHVEVNEKETRIRKRHPLPESAEQCASRHGFGVARCQSVLLRLRPSEKRERTADGEVLIHREGILELPDFGSGIYVCCAFRPDGSFVLEEKYLLYGSKDSGWQARFGEPSYVPGTVVMLRPKVFERESSEAFMDIRAPNQSIFEEYIGTSTFDVDSLRNREDGSKVEVKSELRLTRGRRSVRDNDNESSMLLLEAPMPPPMHFDRDFHASSLSLSRNGRTLSCVSSDGRGTAFGNVGFSKGVHYWEIKLEQADIGSVFVGVAEKPNDGSGSSHAYDKAPRLDRWHGWGFVNFRATYTPGAERIYGAHCHSGDTIGVLLDCDSGRISFFFDGLKYGEHILNDLGCAFENISPFGFNVDGCGSGGAGQGAPSGIEGGRSGRYTAQGCVRPRTLWPVVGLRNQGDRVSFSSKWSSTYGVDSASTVRNIIATEEIVRYFANAEEEKRKVNVKSNLELPLWFVEEAFAEYKRWHSDFWCRTTTRGSGPFPLTTFGLDVDLDSSILSCASASALLGLNRAVLSGDRVRLKRSAGRILELAEEAVVLGSFQGRLYYKIVSQKSEGGSLTEGGGRAWFWDESEVVDGLEVINDSKANDIVLPLMDRFRCTSTRGLKVVYEGGAVIRSDLEIFEGSLNLGSIPIGTIIPRIDVLERRANACGVIRYRVKYDGLEGWISSRIRGGDEESIVITIHQSPEHETKEGGIEEKNVKSYHTSGECALEWLKNYSEAIDFHSDKSGTIIDSIDSFKIIAAEGVIDGFSGVQSDCFLARTVGAICDFCEGGNPLDASFEQVASAMEYAVASVEGRVIKYHLLSSLQANAAAFTAFESLGLHKLPRVQAIMARVSILRAFNRRARIALPWMSIRPCQEGSAILGGMYGYGASIDRAGRSSNKSLLPQWIQLPSIAKDIRSIRGLLFTSVKQDLLRSITEATTTPTPLSHDEYELPREIRTVRINRLRARRVMSRDNVEAKRKYSVFSQLQDETKTWGGAAFRRGFVAKGHGGQKRAFKMKLIGEGVNDYSGPYREAFTDALSEILQVDSNGNGSLGVLDPTPNNESGIGENRGLFMFSLNKTNSTNFPCIKRSLTSTEKSIRSSFSSLIFNGDESSREVEEALVFLGRLTGTAFRHGIPLDLPLPMYSVWRKMAEEDCANNELKELDSLAFQQHGNNAHKSMLILWQQRMLNSFIDGISSVLPVEVFSIFTGEELRDLFCGNPDIDVDMLRRVVEYEGYNESEKVIEYFWEVLRGFTNEERKRFLQFVWARNRLPLKESDFDAPFKIQKDNGNNGDQALPSASTCFFSLSLPEYKSKELLKEKLLFAINNVTTMETDFQTNSAEIAEGYRAF